MTSRHNFMTNRHFFFIIPRYNLERLYKQSFGLVKCYVNLSDDHVNLSDYDLSTDLTDVISTCQEKIKLPVQH